MKNNSMASLALFAVLSAVPLTALADSGFFFAGSVGSATLDDELDGFGIDTESTSFRLTAGWQFSDFLALEGGYHSFGKFNEQYDVGGLITDISLQADGYTLGLTGSVPLGGNMSLFGRAGAFVWDADAVINDIALAVAEDTHLYYGAGADFKVTERFSLIGDWTRYEIEETESDVISIGFRYRF